MTNRLPASIEVRKATLPDNYLVAKQALTACVQVDEAKEWADKASAIATYARQSEDDALLNMATKIKARAIRRAGELLKEFQTGPNGGRPSKNGAGGDPVSQRQAAQAAGMSKKQEKTAVRVANIPEEEFEEAVESDNPPSVTELAKAGTHPAPIIDRGIDPEHFKASTTAQGLIRECIRLTGELSPGDVVSGCLPHEVRPLYSGVVGVILWLEELKERLENED